MKYPACNADLSPIGHLWDQIGRAVRVRVNYTATLAVDYNYEYKVVTQGSFLLVKSFPNATVTQGKQWLKTTAQSKLL